MTATQVFVRFLKDTGNYSSVYPVLKGAYLQLKKVIYSIRGEKYWYDNIYNSLVGVDKEGNQKLDERKIMLDALLKYNYYRFIDAFYAISALSNPYKYFVDSLSKELYKFSIKNLNKYQLTHMGPDNHGGRYRKKINFQYR